MYTLTLDGCGGCYGFIALGRDDNYLPEAENTYCKLRNYACWPKNASVYLCTISSCTFPMKFPILSEFAVCTNGLHVVSKIKPQFENMLRVPYEITVKLYKMMRSILSVKCCCFMTEC